MHHHLYLVIVYLHTKHVLPALFYCCKYFSLSHAQSYCVTSGFVTDKYTKIRVHVYYK